MDAFSIITKKKLGQQLAPEEISALISSYVAGQTTDAQMAAWLMACRLNGMSHAEAAALTMAMADSGKSIDLSGHVFLDKHSTGGVGDKTTFLVGSMLAARGYKVAMMSGRGLGHTGGTIDKLESVRGWKALDDASNYIAIAEKTGFAMMEQTSEIAPADKLLYALRNETATIDSPALIAASIMSKKIASGTRNIVLDVKYGPGAFMKEEVQARELAEMMEGIAHKSGISAVAMVTPMESVLGTAVGNACEVSECWRMMTDAEHLEDPLRQDLLELSVSLAAKAASLVDGRGESELSRELRGTLVDGTAASAFASFIEAHGGSVASDGSPMFRNAGEPGNCEVATRQDGTVGGIDLERLGLIAATLGANKFSPADAIRHDVGFQVLVKKGQRVSRGDILVDIKWLGEEPKARDGRTLLDVASGIRSCFLIA